VRGYDSAGTVTTTVFPGAEVIDVTAPTVAIIGAPSASLTTAWPVSLPVNMTLKAGHTTLLKSGNADADPALGGSGNISRTVTLTNLRGDGALTIQRVAGNAPPHGAGCRAPVQRVPGDHARRHAVVRLGDGRL
jgi:hypothetical protein